MDEALLSSITVNVSNELGLSEFSNLHTFLLKRIKTGESLALHFPEENTTIDTTLLSLSLFKAPQAFEGSPRVLWITDTTDRARYLANKLKELCRRSEIAVELADDKGKMIEQRNHIFEGADIIIGNPKRIHDLYNQNGIHVNQLKLVIIDHLETFVKQPSIMQYIRRVNESLPKCQHIFVQQDDQTRISNFISELVPFHQVLNQNSL
jgi:superfamily II DNA/RNA helicase